MDKKIIVQHSMKTASRLTGISADTIRAWERRYAAVTPQRDAAGRRRFGPGEIARLRWLGELTRKGHAISDIAGLDDAALNALAQEHAPETHSVASQRLVTRIIATVEDYAVAECDELLGVAMASLPTSELIGGVLGPVLKEVGARWRCGEMSIAQERLLSGAINRLVMSVINTLQGRQDAPCLVLATLSGERHELGLLFTALLAAKAGYRCVYLGSDVPSDDVVNAAQRSAAVAVALSVVMPSAGDDMQNDLARIDAKLDANTELWLGGRGAASMTLSRLSPRVTRFDCLYALEDRLFALQRQFALA